MFLSILSSILLYENHTVICVLLKKIEKYRKNIDKIIKYSKLYPVKLGDTHGR